MRATLTTLTTLTTQEQPDVTQSEQPDEEHTTYYTYYTYYTCMLCSLLTTLTTLAVVALRITVTCSRVCLSPRKWHESRALSWRHIALLLEGRYYLLLLRRAGVLVLPPFVSTQSVRWCLGPHLHLPTRISTRTSPHLQLHTCITTFAS